MVLINNKIYFVYSSISLLVGKAAKGTTGRERSVAVRKSWAKVIYPSMRMFWAKAIYPSVMAMRTRN